MNSGRRFPIFERIVIVRANDDFDGPYADEKLHIDDESDVVVEVEEAHFLCVESGQAGGVKRVMFA